MAGLRHLIEALINPYCLLLIAYCFLLFAVLLIKFYAQKNQRSFFTGFALVGALLLLFSTGWIAWEFTTLLEGRYPIIETPDPHNWVYLSIVLHKMLGFVWSQGKG